MSKTIEKLKKWGNQPLGMKPFSIMVILVAAFYLLGSLCYKIYDSDMYFLIATGKEIVKNGIPHTNVWSIDHSSGFIAQQWLYDVLMYVADKFDYIGFTVFVLIQFVLFVFLINHFFNLHGNKGFLKVFAIAVLVFYSELYIFCVRPELITMILLITECIALEHFRRGGKWTWLLLLPFTMILEMNFHGSMWVMHYAVLLAYLVPAFYLPGIHNDNPLRKRWKPLSIFVLIMTLCMLINPYGLDGILYMAKSFAAKTFDYIYVYEVGSPKFFSDAGLVILVSVILLFFNYKVKTLSSVATNMTLGLVFMMMYAIRNVMFSSLVFLFLLNDLTTWLKTLTWLGDSVRASVKKNVIPLLLVGMLMFGGYCFSSIATMFFDDSETSLSMIYKYIDESYTDDTRIFVGFNNGAYFEYKGFKNIYIDARPELYTDDFTGDKDILADYSKFCLYGYDRVSSPQSGDDNTSIYFTKEDIDEWFYSYDFDYLVIEPRIEPSLYMYMLHNENYHLVEFEDAEGDYPLVLYEKNK